MLSDSDKQFIDESLKEDKKAIPPLPWEEKVDPFENFVEEGGEIKNMPQVINDYSKYEVPKGESNYLKMEDGDNRIRLTSKPIELKLHEVRGVKFSTVLCQGENCELCAKGDKIKYKYAYVVLSRKDGKAYVYEAPITVFRQIVAFATDPEYGSPEEYDLTIKMSGQKPNITYQVIASPKKVKLTTAEEEVLVQAHLNLEEQYANKVATA